jgi:hypothetical protein
MNPMASLPMPGGPGFPNMALPGVPQPAMAPGMPAGMGQDAFGPPMSAPAAGSPQGTVFQHPSGGYADNNNNLSGGSFWSSWKGISTIAAGVAVAVYAGIAISKGQLNIFKSADSEYGSKGLHELTGELKELTTGLVNKIKTAKEAFTKDLTKENVDTKVADFKKTFTELKDKNLKSEVTEADYKVFTELETAHSAPIDKIAAKLKEENAPSLDDILNSKDVKDLEGAIETAEETYTKKLKAPETEPAKVEAEVTTTTGGNGGSGAGAQDATANQAATKGQGAAGATLPAVGTQQPGFFRKLGNGIYSGASHTIGRASGALSGAWGWGKSLFTKNKA